MVVEVGKGSVEEKGHYATPNIMCMPVIVYMTLFTSMSPNMPASFQTIGTTKDSHLTTLFMVTRPSSQTRYETGSFTVISQIPGLGAPVSPGSRCAAEERVTD